MLLQAKIPSVLSAEKSFFMNDVDYKLYQAFCEKIPFVFEPQSNDFCMKELAEVVSYVTPGKEPALGFPCLFLTYFANAYFGVAQCCQIDALRSVMNSSKICYFIEYDYGTSLREGKGTRVLPFTKLSLEYWGE